MSAKTTTEYRNVYFRIECGYMTGSGTDRSDQCLLELQSQLERAGWKIEVRRSTGVCPEASKGKSRLYCHPQSVSGIVDTGLIGPVEEMLKQGKNYRYTTTDIYERVYDFTMDELKAHYRRQSRERTELLLMDAFRTKRSNLFKSVAEVTDAVAGKISVRTLLKNSITVSDVELGFVREVISELWDDGLLAIKKGAAGVIIARTNKVAERHEPTLFDT